MFSIRDIGGDEVPELIVSADDGTYFYAYQDGIREIAVLDAGYMEYDPEDGVIVYTSEPALNGKTDRYASWNGQEMTDPGKGGSGDRYRRFRRGLQDKQERVRRTSRSDSTDAGLQPSDKMLTHEKGYRRGTYGKRHEAC